MANPDAPLGYQPYGNRKGLDTPTSYKVTSTNSTIRIGDVVKILTDGMVDLAAADIGPDAIGIAAEYRAANAGGTAETNHILIWDDPSTRFKVQCNTTTAYSQALVGDCCNHAATAGGDIYSAQELDCGSAVGNGNSAQFKIIGICKEPNNTAGTHTNVIVQFAEHFLLASTLGKAV